MKVSVEKEVVEKVLSVTINIDGNKLTLKPNGIFGLEKSEIPVECVGEHAFCAFIGVPMYVYKVKHIYGECKVTEEVYLDCLKMFGE